ncbi:hypothetical protein ABZU32_19530 [Sphaerisporangium sp. NPDC005288]|uniref:hypothetical protein n=1 Tax=Sphaerisporangium sp. NPDC005288 TaxID=3155114 RepID=UPI0033A09E6A
MSSDPRDPRPAGPRSPREGRAPAGPQEPPPLYSRVVTLCRLLGEERFFRAAFGEAGVHPREAAVGERTRVLELDVEEVLRAALGTRTLSAPGPRDPDPEPRKLSGR